MLKHHSMRWGGRLAAAARMHMAASALALMGIVGGPLVAPAHATDLFDTTGGGGTASDYAALSSYNPLGDSFLTGNSPETLTGVGLDLTLAQAASGGFNVYLEPNSTTSSMPSPNSVGDIFLGAISDSSLTLGAITRQTLSVNETLNANTRYWIILTYGGRVATTSAAWIYQANLSSSGLDDATVEYNVAGSQVAPNQSLYPYQMVLTGTVSGDTPIPEPSSLYVLALPLLTLGLGQLVRRAS